MNDIDKMIALMEQGASVKADPAPATPEPSFLGKLKKPVLKALPFVVTLLVSVVVLIAGWSLLQDVSDNPNPPGPRNGIADICERASEKYSENLSHAFARLAKEVEEGKVKTREQLAQAARAYTAAARADAFAAVDSLDNEMIPPSKFVGTDKDGKDFDLTAETAEYLRRKAEGHKRAAK